jgi:uncharacterized protein YcaQ
LNQAEVRRLAVAAQGLHLPGETAPSLESVFGRLGCIQIDSMSAVRRSHELVLLSRGVPALEPGLSFEGMAHALSLIGIELWPAFGFRRRQALANGWRGPEVDMAAVGVVRERLAAQGRVRLRDFGGMTGTGWERDSPFRWALEWLAATGGAVCAGRDRWERMYALPELVIPDPIREAAPDDQDCVRELCRRAIAALGVASTGDVADYYRMRPAVAQAGLTSLGLTRVPVEGWKQPAWLAPGADPAVQVDDDRVTPLSPFDSLVWTRDRLLRIFGKDYRLEAYKPAAKRTFGYFALPVLAGSEIAGRVACRRRAGVLVVENMELDPHLPRTVLDRAVATLAAWTASDSVTYEDPAHA